MKSTITIFIFISLVMFACSKGDGTFDTGLAWPIDCIPDKDCLGSVGYADINNDGVAWDCGSPGYTKHQGTDVGAEYGTEVYAAADGQVLWVCDGKADKCSTTDANSPDCTDPGYRCTKSSSGGSVIMNGGNVIVIKHPNTDNVYATRYDHLKKNSILVSEGDSVVKGQKIAEVGDAGASSGPHLHFEVWSTGIYILTDPFAGNCSPASDGTNSDDIGYTKPIWLWEDDPAWGK